MDNKEFEQLSSIWQSAEQKELPEMDTLLKRHKRQHLVLKVNFCIELVAILAVSVFFVVSLFKGFDLIKQLWVGFATVWGITIFVLMNKSRLSSLRQLRSEQISTSIEVHSKLIKNEIFRWTLSVKATWIFVAALMVFAIARCYFLNCTISDLLNIGISFLVLLASIVFFARKNKKAKEVLSALEQ
ncbi:hypothetical protein [Pseudoalteromonas luteoviolacea]|uniref:Uncharacterized protein n=1 Tax=Pseudoalteromonas luteoviolacea (strain 2ta16) TaxID=1353533 RepID=V4HV59_PSEL2|nr:hypothetical protein [Pseudoalteromonas luteoviolacea]ESP93683.1 hypothetical protein PL2TA16_02887 [Pseudoalteromonas luteoviolacea 2ta16]KZN41199.1 hypothetical protein N483_16440 [Pseudoalteromonas luteoviolacea NCIMB 1944]